MKLIARKMVINQAEKSKYPARLSALCLRIFYTLDDQREATFSTTKVIYQTLVNSPFASLDYSRPGGLVFA